MSWRKPLKNKKRFDARYFLNERKMETVENSVQQEEVKKSFNDFSFDSWSLTEADYGLTEGEDSLKTAKETLEKAENKLARYETEQRNEPYARNSHDAWANGDVSMGVSMARDARDAAQAKYNDIKNRLSEEIEESLTKPTSSGVVGEEEEDTGEEDVGVISDEDEEEDYGVTES